MDKKLLDFLNQHEITYTPYEHEAVFTVEAAEKVFPNIAWMHVKNLFLKDKFWKFYLVCIEVNKKLPIKNFWRKFGLKELSFWSPEQLFQEMQVLPGSVSLFGLIYAKNISLYLDKDIWSAERVWWHPNENTATLMIEHEWLEKFLKAVDVEPTVFDFEDIE